MRLRRIFSGGQPSWHQRVHQRTRTRQHEVHAPEHFQKRAPEGRLVEFDQHVRTVERHDRRPAPARVRAATAGVARPCCRKKCAAASQCRRIDACAAGAFHPGSTGSVARESAVNDAPQPPPTAPREPRLHHRRETAAFSRFWVKTTGETARPRQLPVDVQHLRLEESRAITSDDPAAIHGGLELDREQLQALRSAGTDRPLVAGHVAAVAVFGGRVGVDHLQRVAVADRARTTLPSTRGAGARSRVRRAIARGAAARRGARCSRAGRGVRVRRTGGRGRGVVWACSPKRRTNRRPRQRAAKLFHRSESTAGYACATEIRGLSRGISRGAGGWAVWPPRKCRRPPAFARGRVPLLS